MKNKTPFRIAAEKYFKRDYRSVGCCFQLRNSTEFFLALECELFFKRTFEPTHGERVQFETGFLWWMESYKQTPEQNRNDRILALLFCEQLWLDEQKYKSK